MKILKAQEMFCQDVAKLIIYIFSRGYTCTMGEAYRTPEQAQLYAHQGKGIIDSQHCRRLAIDINIFDPHGNYLTDSKDYEPFAEYWESLDIENRNGMHFSKADGNHFERKLTA